MHTHHTQVLLIHMVMAAWDTRATITTISSNLIIPIHSLQEHIKTQVLLISLFPPFRILGLMLDPQVIQALITILLIIRLLEVTKTAADMEIKRLCGTMAVTLLIHILITPRIPVVPIVLVLPLLQCSISNSTNSGQTTTTKQKSAVHLEQRTYLSQVHLLWVALFLQLLVVMQLQVASLSSHIHHFGGKSPALPLYLLFRFEITFRPKVWKKDYLEYLT